MRQGPPDPKTSKEPWSWRVHPARWGLLQGTRVVQVEYRETEKSGSEPWPGLANVSAHPAAQAGPGEPRTEVM